MGRKPKATNILKDVCILHIPYNIENLIRESVKRGSVNFDDIKGYDDSEDLFFLSNSPSEVCFSNTLPQQPRRIITTEVTSAFDILREFDKQDEKSWVKRTDICCWWCAHQFDTVPLGIPVEFDGEIFKVRGCFCSFSCLTSYNKDSKESGCYYLIKAFYKALVGKVFDENVSEAPPKEMLCIFGGPYSIKEFRNKSETFNGSIKTSYNKLLPPMISWNYQIEECVKTTRKLGHTDEDNNLASLRVSNAAKSIKNNTSENNIIPVDKIYKKTKLSDFFEI